MSQVRKSPNPHDAAKAPNPHDTSEVPNEVLKSSGAARPTKPWALRVPVSRYSRYRE